MIYLLGLWKLPTFLNTWSSDTAIESELCLSGRRGHTHTHKRNPICYRKKHIYIHIYINGRKHTHTHRHSKRWYMMKWGRTWQYFLIPEAISIHALSKKFPFLLKFLCRFNVTCVIFSNSNKMLSEACPQASGFLSSHIGLCAALAHHRAVVGFYSRCPHNSWTFFTWLTQPLCSSSKSHWQQPDCWG